MFEHTARRPMGNIIMTGSEYGPAVEIDTVQCCHCSQHYAVQPGSGKERGWCTLCMGPTCGQHKCGVSCTPFEKKLEEYERGSRLVLD